MCQRGGLYVPHALLNLEGGIVKRVKNASVDEVIKGRENGVDITPTYRKVAHSGNARYLAVTHQLPPDWRMVEVTASIPKGKVLTLTVRKVD